MNLALARQSFAPSIAAQASLEAARARCLLYLAAALLALCLPALALDLPVAQAMKDHRPQGDLHKILSLSEAFSHGFGVLTILAVCAALDHRGWRIAPRLLACSLGAGAFANLAKLLLSRWRPKAMPPDGDVWDTFVAWLPVWNQANLPKPWDAALQSFPSGHTAAGVGLAIGLSVLYPRGRWLFAALAILGALQRIESRSHFVSDTIAGAAIAALIASACFAPTLFGRWFGRLEAPSSTPSPAL